MNFCKVYFSLGRDAASIGTNVLEEPDVSILYPEDRGSRFLPFITTRTTKVSSY
jgi:hypothetical protein